MITSPAVVRKVLEMSTTHIPVRHRDDLAETRGVVAHEVGDASFLLWVPEEPLIYALDGGGYTPPEIVNIQMFARRNGCDYVLFQPDSPVMEQYPHWD